MGRVALLALLALSLAAPAAHAADRQARAEVDNGVLALLVAPGTRSLVVHAAASPVTVERRYALDRGTGTIRFGDGVRGAIPPTGGTITVAYTTGSGEKDDDEDEGPGKPRG